MFPLSAALAGPFETIGNSLVVLSQTIVINEVMRRTGASWTTAREHTEATWARFLDREVNLESAEEMINETVQAVRDAQ